MEQGDRMTGIKGRMSLNNFLTLRFNSSPHHRNFNVYTIMASLLSTYKSQSLLNSLEILKTSLFRLFY